MNKKLVIFDFDGVLVNTCDFWYRLHKEFNHDLTWERFESMSHGNFRDIYKEVLANGDYVDPPQGEEKYAEMLQTIASIEDILHDVVLGLKSLHELMIVSSGSEVTIRRFLEKENLDGCFSEILGFETHTSKKIKITSILEKYKIEKNNVVFITDTLGDVLEANECKISTIGVTWGLHKRETLEKGNVRAIIDDPTQLFETVEKILQ